MAIDWSLLWPHGPIAQHLTFQNVTGPTDTCDSATAIEILLSHFGGYRTSTYGGVAPIFQPLYTALVQQSWHFWPWRVK